MSLNTKTVAFITGSKDKLREVESFFTSVCQIPLNIPELQSTQPEEVVKHKLKIAIDLVPNISSEKDLILVEDTGLIIDGMGRLPGPFIKWFLDEIDLDKIVLLSKAMGSGHATAYTCFACIDGTRIGSNSNILDNISVFRGETSGKIITKRGENGFGWDSIFRPDNSDKTFAEMLLIEKIHHSMRGKAIKELLRSLKT